MAAAATFPQVTANSVEQRTWRNLTLRQAPFHMSFLDDPAYSLNLSAGLVAVSSAEAADNRDRVAHSCICMLFPWMTFLNGGNLLHAPGFELAFSSETAFDFLE
jgi:hypothetical protein